VNTGRIYISRDVVFDEAVFPFEKLHDNAGAYLHKEILLHDPSHTFLQKSLDQLFALLAHSVFWQ
jgi:hypothetical protein